MREHRSLGYAKATSRLKTKDKESFHTNMTLICSNTDHTVKAGLSTALIFCFIKYLPKIKSSSLKILIHLFRLINEFRFWTAKLNFIKGHSQLRQNFTCLKNDQHTRNFVGIF